MECKICFNYCEMCHKNICCVCSLIPGADVTSCDSCFDIILNQIKLFSRIIPLTEFIAMS